jgi:hypothetical protein
MRYTWPAMQRTSAGKIAGKQPGRLSLGNPLAIVFF